MCGMVGFTVMCILQRRACEFDFNHGCIYSIIFWWRMIPDPTSKGNQERLVM